MTDAVDNAAAKMRTKVSELGGKFLTRTRDQVNAMREHVAKIADGDASLLEPLQQVAHMIHGSGAVFGFADISEAADLLERASAETTGALPGGDLTAHRIAAQRLSEHLERLARALQCVEGSAMVPELSAGNAP